MESHDHAIRLKAEIMVDHFHEQVLALGKIGGQARAMVVTSGIERAMQYFSAISDYLLERKSPYRAIVAFSGEHEYGGAKVTETSLNGFPSSQIADKIQGRPGRLQGPGQGFPAHLRVPRLDPAVYECRVGETVDLPELPRPQAAGAGGPWTDADRIHRLIAQDIPNRVAADGAYRNAKQNSDRQNARIEHDKALDRVMTAVLKDDTELFKQFSDNESFRRWLADTVFRLTYERPQAS